MKKITLIAALAAFSMQITHAQIPTSFEESEGFVEGPLNGQNGWASSAGFDANFLINEDEASDGDFSLFLSPTNAGSLIVGFSPLEFSTEDVVAVTVDMLIETPSGTPSTVEFATQTPAQGFLTSRVRFNPDETITALSDDPANPGTLIFDSTGENYEFDEWFELRIEHRFADEEIDYYIDEDLIFTGTLVAGTIVEQALPIFDNMTNGAYFDNLRFEDGVLSIDENNLDDVISVYPNPTQGNLNINFARSLGDVNVDIINVSGQLVMTESINGVGNNVINTSRLSQGVYFAQIVTETGATTVKFIKN